MAETGKSTSGMFSMREKVTYGLIGSLTGVGSLFASSCVSRCNGCMSCAVGGIGFAGMLIGVTIFGKFTHRDTPEKSGEGMNNNLNNMDSSSEIPGDAKT